MVAVIHSMEMLIVDDVEVTCIRDVNTCTCVFLNERLHEISNIVAF